LEFPPEAVLMGLETIAIGAMVAGTATSAIGSYSAGRAGKAAKKREAELAALEKREAGYLTDYRVRLIREEGAGLLGEIEAETGKSGLALTGTPLTTLVDNARRIELSAAVEKRAGAVTQMRYDQQIAASLADAKAAGKAGTLGAISSLLGGVGGLYSAGAFGKGKPPAVKATYSGVPTEGFYG
jgi:hypothetical protein